MRKPFQRRNESKGGTVVTNALATITKWIVAFLIIFLLLIVLLCTLYFKMSPSSHTKTPRAAW